VDAAQPFDQRRSQGGLTRFIINPGVFTLVLISLNGVWYGQVYGAETQTVAP
jgi:hypothetical protein